MCPICRRPVVIDPIQLQSGDLAHRRCTPTARIRTPVSKTPVVILASYRAATPHPMLRRPA